MNKLLDKAGDICNRNLGILYIPLSLFSILLYMASESTIGANNPLYIGLINLFCVITLAVPFLCFGGIFLSAILRNKGCSVASFVVQFVPLAVFALNQLLLTYAETLPRKI